MDMPKRIYAWRYHPDNAKNRAQGAWDTREGERSKSDVDFVRDDIARGLAEALREAREFIRAEYESPRAQALEGEVLAADARPIWNTLAAAIAAYEEE